MERFKKVIIMVFSLILTSVVPTSETIIIDHWFFAQPMLGNGRPEKFKIRTKNMIVHSDETFGIAIRYASFKPQAKLQIKLIVPTKPENFPCKSCKTGEFVILPDGHTIIVNKVVDSSAGLDAFFSV